MGDKDHIIRLRKDDGNSFKYLYDKYSGLIFHISTEMGLEKEAAEEIVQDVFLKIWEKRMELDESLSFKAYILAIAKNLVLKHIRRKMHDLAYQKYYEYFFSLSSFDTENQIYYEDMLQNTEKIIEKLPPAQKEIFLLHRHGNVSSKEISKQLTLSLRTVENQLYRANKKILEYLRKQNLISILLGAWLMDL